MLTMLHTFIVTMLLALLALGAAAVMIDLIDLGILRCKNRANTGICILVCILQAATVLTLVLWLFSLKGGATA